MTTKNTITVIGAGAMGRGIAQVCAQGGYHVQLHDALPEAMESAVAQIGKMLDRSVEKGRMSADDAASTKRRIVTVDKVSGLKSADFIIEAATETPAIKVEILQAVQDKLVDGGILATNTSSISITRLASAVACPHRFVGMHFFNPVPLMKLVEVVRGLQTDDETVARTVKLAETLGKTPVECNDSPGFVSNRVLMPMINEAICCLQEGVAEPAAIDDIMKLGCNHPMGPLALADLIGLDVCLHIMEVLHRDMGEDRYRPCPLLRKMVVGGRLGRKTKRGFFEYD